MEWTKKLPLSWLVAALSLAGNIGLGFTAWTAQQNFIAVEQKLDALEIHVEIYDGDTFIISFDSLSTGFQTLGEFLEQVAEDEIIGVELSGVSEWGRYIIALADLDATSENSEYWAMFSDTNVACAGLPNYDNTMTNYCSLGIDSIYVVGGDNFTFKLLGY